MLSVVEAFNAILPSRGTRDDKLYIKFQTNNQQPTTNNQQQATNNKQQTELVPNAPKIVVNTYFMRK
ncbi:hypothetical protein BKM63_21065 [Flavobacterium johnsoniae]|uniref:Uncharacterized protein n=1 Tax=Flavobacterium johnsoniae TaxID=986 RepID=A0A1J7CEB1_FLAJO|nr:hypothetical protein BKM63_21065 [Flavobacterium johnsoniae]